MAQCINCGAPLPPSHITCEYCGSRNDTDLKGVHAFTVHEPHSQRICPRCDDAMETIDLKLEGRFYIERCPRCMGLFFDPGELEVLLDASVRNVFHINRKKMDHINTAMAPEKRTVQYVKCPVCRTFMNRSGFGTRSGVIVDRCAEHGIWLEGGELRHLFEWAKAGGMHLDAQTREIKQEEARKEKAARTASHTGLSDGFMIYDDDMDVGEMDLVDLLKGLTTWLMR